MSSYRMKYKIGATQYNIPVMDDITSGGGIPLGTILPYASNINLPPEGFLYCEGQAISRTMYADLFSLIGTTYGIGDGSTTFNLPNLVGGEFLEASGTAGTTKNPGLPNIEAGTENYGLAAVASGTTKGTGAANLSSNVTGYGFPQSGAYTSTKYWTFDASLSNSIYGNSQTVQPKALTVRYIIKVFDSATSSSALIDITQYASDLSTRLQRQQVPAFNRRVELRTSQTWTAPVTGWYKFTIKGAGGGGGTGFAPTSSGTISGAGGGEGGTTFAVEKMNAGDTAIITIGAGGAGTTGSSGSGSDGGDSSLFINNTTYTAGGGKGGKGYFHPGVGGSGTIKGANGFCGTGGYGFAQYGVTPVNGGAMPSTSPESSLYGAGGVGGAVNQGGSYYPSGAGGDGYCFIEYFDPTL